jgi:hypothetical protein
MPDKGWQRKFEDPIPLPDGRELVKLRDAAEYITSLPKKEAPLPELQTAIEVLMLCSRSGPTMLARIAVMKALNGQIVQVLNTEGKILIGANGSSRGINDRADLRRYQQARRRPKPPQGVRKCRRR